MKHANCPRSLYKYLPPERTDVIRDLRVRYTQLAAFNDPFEGRPHVSAMSPPARAQRIFGEVVLEEAERSWLDLPLGVRMNISREKWQDLCVQIVDGNRDQLLTTYQGLAPAVQAVLFQKFDLHLGTLSLSETRDSLLMWAHYAASHSGFAIQFDPQHAYFHEQRSSEDEFRHIRKVEYHDSRPSASLSDLDGIDLFFVKSTQWAYEQEWRIVRALDESETRIASVPHEIHLFGIPADAVVGITLGARAQPPLRSEIRSLVGRDDLSHVRVSRAVPATDHFCLRFVDDA